MDTCFRRSGVHNTYEIVYNIAFMHTIALATYIPCYKLWQMRTFITALIRVGRIGLQGRGARILCHHQQSGIRNSVS